uniref:Uncharacterized protein n=1 Tax=Brassica campestris TaxID=3711 RepID=M4F4L7_BRACM
MNRHTTTLVVLSLLLVVSDHTRLMIRVHSYVPFCAYTYDYFSYCLEFLTGNYYKPAWTVPHLSQTLEEFQKSFLRSILTYNELEDFLNVFHELFKNLKQEDYQSLRCVCQVESKLTYVEE